MKAVEAGLREVFPGELFEQAESKFVRSILPVVLDIAVSSARGAFALQKPLEVAASWFSLCCPVLKAAQKPCLTSVAVPAAVAGGKAATPTVKPVTAAALKEESGKLYRAMEAEGVQIRPQAMTDLAAAIRPKLGDMRYDPDTDKLVGEALRLFGLKAGQPMSFDMLEEFRKSIRDLPYTQSGAGRGTPKERAIIAALDDTIDDFMDGLTPAQTTGDAAAATAFLTKARAVRGRSHRSRSSGTARPRRTRRVRRRCR